MKKSGRVCMGREVIHHSPDKHPEQDDPYAAMDKQTEEAAKASTGTYSNARKVMKPMQTDQPRDKAAGGVLDYLKKMGGYK